MRRSYEKKAFHLQDEGDVMDTSFDSSRSLLGTSGSSDGSELSRLVTESERERERERRDEND